jgi:hypothetical protein
MPDSSHHEPAWWILALNRVAAMTLGPHMVHAWLAARPPRPR